MTTERFDPLRALDDAMADCFKCQRMTPTERDQHRADSLAEVTRTQSRPLETLTLPAHAWPNGKAPKK